MIAELLALVDLMDFIFEQNEVHALNHQAYTT